MPTYHRKHKTFLLHDGNKVIIYRGEPGVTENCFSFKVIWVRDISDERVDDINEKARRYCQKSAFQAWATLNDMGPVIYFLEKETTYTGRNGTGRMIGMEILENAAGDSISLTPINTKGLANCQLNIPKEALGDMIESLRKIKEKK